MCNFLWHVGVSVPAYLGGNSWRIPVFLVFFFNRNIRLAHGQLHDLSDSRCPRGLWCAKKNHLPKEDVELFAPCIPKNTVLWRSSDQFIVQDVFNLLHKTHILVMFIVNEEDLARVEIRVCNKKNLCDKLFKEGPLSTLWRTGYLSNVTAFILTVKFR